ncbi:MAG: hypothetical protein FWE24_07165 [Defluviitaleaceae bacterium]|nr:hypothetical protein [Defluviitaleaceae bacterium]
MQLKIARILNKALVYMAVLVVLMLAGGFYITLTFPDYFFHYIVGCVIALMVLLLIFRYYEANWDKKVIIKMALNKKIALVNIESASRELPMRDSGFRNYWLYSFEGTLYPQEGGGISVKFYEKMSADTKEIPTGSVYVTYDERKPAQIFIVPTDLLARIPYLEDVVKSYENRDDVDCRYLYAYYKHGMELKRYQDIV